MHQSSLPSPPPPPYFSSPFSLSLCVCVCVCVSLTYGYSVVPASFVENTILSLFYILVKNLVTIYMGLLLE